MTDTEPELVRGQDGDLFTRGQQWYKVGVDVLQAGAIIEDSPILASVVQRLWERAQTGAQEDGMVLDDRFELVLIAKGSLQRGGS